MSASWRLREARFFDTTQVMNTEVSLSFDPADPVELQRDYSLDVRDV
jgi:hypothetical protein